MSIHRIDDLVLIVEDDTSTAASMVGAILRGGYQVSVAISGRDALDRCAAEQPDVITVELRVPDLGGAELCRQLRGLSTAPIIVVTGDMSEDAKIGALDAGADDVISKPFSMPELIARIRAGLRRRHELDPYEASRPHQLQVGDLTLNLDNRFADIAGARIKLSPKEFDFLALLARQPGQLVTHERILRRVWGADAVGKTEYLRVMASQLRKKLIQHPRAPRVVTEPWAGYRLVADT